MPNQPTFLVVLDQSIMGKGERGGGFLTFFPFKKEGGGGRNLVPRPGHEIKGGLIRDDGS